MRHFEETTPNFSQLKVKHFCNNKTHKVQLGFGQMLKAFLENAGRWKVAKYVEFYRSSVNEVLVSNVKAFDLWLFWSMLLVGYFYLIGNMIFSMWNILTNQEVLPEKMSFYEIVFIEEYFIYIYNQHTQIFKRFHVYWNEYFICKLIHKNLQRVSYINKWALINQNHSNFWSYSWFQFISYHFLQTWELIKK